MKRRIPYLYAAFAALTLAGYVGLERTGWATGGSARPAIPTEQIRQAPPGSWQYVYWSHGYRGK